MEFIKTLIFVHRRMPVPFYTLLVAFPGAVIGVLYVVDITLSSPESIFRNVYIVAMFAFIAFLNVCFWLKLHFQRMGDYAKAEKWMHAPTWASLAMMLAIVLVR